MSVNNIRRPDPFANNTYYLPVKKLINPQHIDPQDGQIKKGLMV